MDLEGLWDATVGDLGAHQRLRDVGGGVRTASLRVTRMNRDLWRLNTLRYHAMIVNEELRGLDGRTYPYALWNGLFAVPELVLHDRQDEYGWYAYVLSS
ncbi:hypothetical protein L914_21502 [Phytophthora nicotianae]|uniref:Uncharacterized protein n=2 Tax=Phytophthora nicotianae TaxID=4792 RepID=V9DU92_PHYNI|nr:hypothetical protein F443_22438 [Phytophthora nicotianae P1569]ETM30821.1 hypothetical protein L914_21502 [Phytophthora nicotianae]